MTDRRSPWFEEPTDWDAIETDPKMLGNTPVTYLVFNPETGLVKIGATTELRKRMYSLRTQHKADLELLSYRAGRGKSWARKRGDALDVEKDLHDEFRKYRVEGEWFTPARGIYAYFGCLA